MFVSCYRQRKPESETYRNDGSSVKDPAENRPMILDRLGDGWDRRFVQEVLAEGYGEEYYRMWDQRFFGDEGFGEELMWEGHL